MTRISAVDDDPGATTSVVDRIGEPARALVADPETALVAVAEDESSGGAGVLARRGDRWELRTTPTGQMPIVDALVGHAAASGGGPCSWFVAGATDADVDAADRAGLRPGRTLFQMRCELPLAAHATIATRPYRPGIDRAAWLEVNNRAFSWHPEQGGWSEDDIAAGEREAWFDAEGFLLHEVDGRLAGFCWTKVHDDVDPALGEIYVIAVDPSFHGRGLGRELTLAGLDHLGDRGLRVGMLYVESDNEAAVGLYRSLGFTVHQRDVFFTGEIPAA